MIFTFYRARAVQSVLLWVNVTVSCRSYNPLWDLWVGQAFLHKEWGFFEESVLEGIASSVLMKGAWGPDIPYKCPRTSLSSSSGCSGKQTLEHP